MPDGIGDTHDSSPVIHCPSHSLRYTISTIYTTAPMLPALPALAEQRGSTEMSYPAGASRTETPGSHF